MANGNGRTCDCAFAVARGLTSIVYSHPNGARDANGSTILNARYWRVQDVDALYAECRDSGLSRSGTTRLSPVENKPWGMREFGITDPDGNLVRGGELASSET